MLHFIFKLFFLKVHIRFIFAAMEELDADDKRLFSNGHYAERDIVQVQILFLCFQSVFTPRPVGPEGVLSVKVKALKKNLVNAIT